MPFKNTIGFAILLQRGGGSPSPHLQGWLGGSCTPSPTCGIDGYIEGTCRGEGGRFGWRAGWCWGRLCRDGVQMPDAILAQAAPAPLLPFSPTQHWRASHPVGRGEAGRGEACRFGLSEAFPPMPCVGAGRARAGRGTPGCGSGGLRGGGGPRSFPSPWSVSCRLAPDPLSLLSTPYMSLHIRADEGGTVHSEYI